jgi:hypothetical protein
MVHNMDGGTPLNTTAGLAECIHTLAEGSDECRDPSHLRGFWKALLLPDGALLSCMNWHGGGAEQARHRRHPLGPETVRIGQGR